MKQNIFFVLKEVIDENFNVIYEELVPEITQEPNYDAVIAALKKSEETLENAFFLKKMYLKKAFETGVSFGTIMVILIFVLLVFYEFKKKNK